MITAEQVTVAAQVTRPEHVTAAAAQDVDLTGIDAALAQIAMTRPHADLGKVVHHYLARLKPDGREPDPTEGRRLSIHSWSDGTVTGTFQLDPIGGEKVQAALESIVQADRPKGDDRSRSQQLADGLVQLCDNALASGELPQLRGSKPHVMLTLAAADLFDPAVVRGLGRLGFGSWLTQTQARHAGCDADLTPLLLDEHGAPLDMGRTRRLFPPHIRRALVVRDGHCVFAGCAAPSYWCDVHHLVHWVDGGETSADSGALLCERHHTKVHHGFTIQRDPQGRWHTYRPDGTEILIHPLLI